MKVSPAEPFQLIYSLYQHEYLGYLIESFVVQLDEKGRLSFTHQNISSKNADEFRSVMDERDFELIKIMDSMQQESVIKHFVKKKIKPDEFFLKNYSKDKGNEMLQQQIEAYLERRRAKVLSLLYGKHLYEMGRDGEPAWKQIHLREEKATVLFHFRRNEENTHYFPTIKHGGEKVDWQYKGAYIICNQPAWIVVDDQLLNFEKEVDGNKLKPFLNKKFIVIPKKVEETYYRKFVSQLVASFDVYAKGFDIVTETHIPKPVMKISELAEAQQSAMSLFGDGDGGVATAAKEEVSVGKIVFDISFRYGPYTYRADNSQAVSVSMEQDGDQYTFHRVRRDLKAEHRFLEEVRTLGWNFRNGRFTVAKTTAFGLLALHRKYLEEAGVVFEQTATSEKRYFLGETSIDIEVRENIDWFDIYAVVKFGDYEMPFKELRKLMIKGKAEINLPNGEVAVIPETWFSEYSELFAFMEEGEDNDFALKKHHLALVKDLESGNLAKVSMSRKLERLREFDQIEDIPMPKNFKGELRPYQKAGFNWMSFLNEYNFGGCLADDMGLGKTVQTLALLQSQKEQGAENATLLVMPTSLIYNWEREAARFTPDLKVFTYTGTNRAKNTEQFQGYDLILTSYGIARLDAEDVLKEYYFNYIILDESQAIKNPTSNIAKAVKKLASRRRLILTGTPLENSTMDLWSQMSFVNPGLLGTQRFFRNEFLNPIEKKKNEKKTEKLYSIIKPFIMRRHKSQVATELPEKVENVQYSDMTEEQNELYEEVKTMYRDQIVEHMEQNTLKDNQFLLLQGLTKLRQIANHPNLTHEDYTGGSGKMEDMLHMLENALREDHKILIFSSFVKHLQLVKNHLDEKGHAYAYLDGGTKNRQKEVERFQEDSSLKIFLISLKAGGLGLNLTQADYVFLLDPWWNPAIEAQAVDRAHRIGQKNKVFTYKFITRGTVEEKILALQEKKRQLAADLITTEESFVKNLTRDHIISLLE